MVCVKIKALNIFNMWGVKKVGDEMNNQELCILLDSILALLETDNADKAKEVIENAIKRIDKGNTTSTRE